MQSRLLKLPEPLLLFRHRQAMEDPRDGLTLFGPLDFAAPLGVRAGVVGTEQGISLFQRWVGAIQHPIRTAKPIASRPPFSGFASIFRVPWAIDPIQKAVIQPAALRQVLYQDD